MTECEALDAYMNAHRLRLATAESCTAGLIASMLADIEGCGAWLECGFVLYSPAAKQAVVDVQAATIEKDGLTSEAVAREMAEGALSRSKATVAVANTGVAGPGPAEDGTPEGTVCFAWAFNIGGATRTHAETRRFDGDRNQIRKLAALHAIARLPAIHGELL